MGSHGIVDEVLVAEGFLRSSSMRPMLVLRIFVILYSWLLTLLDKCASWVQEVLAVFCTSVPVHYSNPVLAACRLRSFCTHVKVASCSCCSCCSWACRPWNYTLLRVRPLLQARAMPLRLCSRNCSGTLWITTSRALSVDAATVACRGQCGNNYCALHSGGCCHTSKCKANSGQL